MNTSTPTSAHPSLPYVGQVYETHKGFEGYTYARRISSGGYETFDGIATCVGPFLSWADAAEAVRAQNLVERAQYLELSSRPFDDHGRIPGASDLDVQWMLAVHRHQPAWLTWRVDPEK